MLTDKSIPGLPPKHIREAYPNIKVLIVTSLVDPEVLRQARRGCADSLWYKDHGTDAIMDVIRRTMAGSRSFRAFLPPSR